MWADDEPILARPSPLRRLAEHAEILYPGTGADQDVRKINGRWLITKLISSSVTLKP